MKALQVLVLAENQELLEGAFDGIQGDRMKIFGVEVKELNIAEGLALRIYGFTFDGLPSEEWQDAVVPYIDSLILISNSGVYPASSKIADEIDTLVRDCGDIPSIVSVLVDQGVFDNMNESLVEKEHVLKNNALLIISGLGQKESAVTRAWKSLLKQLTQSV